MQNFTNMQKFTDSYHYFLYLLGRRDYSVQELREKGLGKNFMASDIEVNLQKLLDLKYLDETRYCNIIIENYQPYKGQNWILQKLAQKKIPQDIINQEIQNYIFEPSNNFRNKVLSKYNLKNFKNVEQKTTAKIISYIARAGYSNSYEIFKKWESQEG